MSLARLIILASAILSPAIAMAQSTPPEISCGQARALVNSRGAAVVYSSRHIYDRYVTSAQFCSVGETTKAAFIPTTDTYQCFVGYRCVPLDYGRFNR
ncbi:MAG: hypothetical protein ACRCWO_02840 [Bosea sp. (in: a-proteobacteria)]